MRAMLLAAGLGTRLRPITNKLPKCLVTIKGKTLLEIWIEKLANLGIEKILINTHYLANIVESYIRSGIYNEYIDITYEEKLLGTAGTVLKNIDYFNGQDAMIIHADNYCIDGLEGLIEAHKNRPSRCLMTMLVFRTDEPSKCGIVERTNEGIVKAFYEKSENPPGNIANGAIYILSAEALSEIKSNHKNAVEFTLEIMPNFIDRIFTFETSLNFLDIGSLKNYQLAQDI
jgi:mannose-1-phosphate guanylyltransferase